MAVSARYGYHRDELYFLAAGRHLAFGYVDQPPLTPLLARLTAAATGNTLTGLRLLPALMLAGLVVATAGMSRLLGAGRTGQLLAALATATCGEYLGTMHLLTTTGPDFLCSTITLLFTLRLLASGNTRWWAAIGVSAGLGAAAKWDAGLLAGAMVLGFAATPARRLLFSRWLLLGAVVAAALGAPDVAWQAAHGWPNFAVFRALAGHGWHNRATYWPAQVVYTGLALAPMWVRGLAWSLRSAQCRRFRPVAIACAVTLVAYFALGGKPYYPGAVFTFLFAAGSVPLERWLAARPRPAGKSIRPAARKVPAAAVAGAMIVSGLLTLPAALPVLPASALRTVPLQKINYDLAETIAWPKLVALVARQYLALPAARRRHTAIITANYGEAGAVDRYGAALGLPQAYSGANNFWLWGPPPAADTSAIVINMNPALLRREFAGVRLVGVFDNGIGVSNDEQGAQVFAADGRRASWQRSWKDFRDYS